MAPLRTSLRRRPLLALIILILLLGGGYTARALQEHGSGRPSVTAPTSAGPNATTGHTGAAPSLVPLSSLPPEARQTIALIQRGGPFPYQHDAIVYQNLERQLPKKPAGYYREYTVPTPGESDRGARRIVTGRDGSYYYTDDHYASFRKVDLSG